MRESTLHKNRRNLTSKNKRDPRSFRIMSLCDLVDHVARKMSIVTFLISIFMESNPDHGGIKKLNK